MEAPAPVWRRRLPRPSRAPPPEPPFDPRFPRRTEEELSQLRALYLESYTGAEKLYQQQRRAGLPFTLAEVKTFVKEQPIAQRFAPAQPADPGHWTALSENDVWMCDLIDMSRYSSASQKAKKWLFITLCIFDRKLFAVPMANKLANSTASAFKTVVERAGGSPVRVFTDNGQEYAGAFAEALREVDAVHTKNMPGDHEAMGPVDRAILTLRTRINKWMEASGETDWVGQIDRIVADYNETPHGGLRNRAPNDISASEYNQGEVRLDNAIKVHRFRSPLKRGPFARGFTPRYGLHVYTVERIRGGFVESEGLKFQKKRILVVPAGSQDVASNLEREATARRTQRREQRRLRRLDPTYVFEGDEDLEDDEDVA